MTATAHTWDREALHDQRRAHPDLSANRIGDLVGDALDCAEAHTVAKLYIVGEIENIDRADTRRIEEEAERHMPAPADARARLAWLSAQADQAQKQAGEANRAYFQQLKADIEQERAEREADPKYQAQQRRERKRAEEEHRRRADEETEQQRYQERRQAERKAEQDAIAAQAEADWGPIRDDPRLVVRLLKLPVIPAPRTSKLSPEELAERLHRKAIRRLQEQGQAFEYFLGGRTRGFSTLLSDFDKWYDAAYAALVEDRAPDETMQLFATAFYAHGYHGPSLTETGRPMSFWESTEKYEQQVAERRWLDITEKLLAKTFALGDGTRVSWGRATVQQHKRRVAMLNRMALGDVETATRHLMAVNRIEATTGATCLEDVKQAEAAA